MKDKPYVGFLGLGYVGLVTATVLASRGYSVRGVDIIKDKVSRISKGEPPIFEPGLGEMIKKSIKEGNLKVSTDYDNLLESKIIFITVGTPSLSNGDIDLRYVFDAIVNLINMYKRNLDRKELEQFYPVIVIKSTVIPGTTKRLANYIERKFKLKVGKELGIVSNPEFLREGKAIEDTLNPSRVVIGEVDKSGADTLENFWRNFYKEEGKNIPILRVPSPTAEMIKYASNTFLAMKISFANTIARICEKIQGCDISDVIQGMSYDPRINPSFLGAGLGYGGSCFPKDVKALFSYAKRLCVESHLLEAVDMVNETQPEHVMKMLEEALGNLNEKIIVILGVAFKPDTDDIRESRSLLLAELLLERGAHVRLHDPNINALNKVSKILGKKAEYHLDLKDALEKADAAVIGTDWNTYKSMKPNIYLKLMKRPLILDARRIYNPQDFLKKGIEFYAVGLGR